MPTSNVRTKFDDLFSNEPSKDYNHTSVKTAVVNRGNKTEIVAVEVE